MSTLANKEMELFNQYKQTGDINFKKDLLFSLKPLIVQKANEFSSSGLPISAIEMEGHRLAAGAIDTYDPTKSKLNTHIVNNLQKINRFVFNYQNAGYIPEKRILMINKYQTIKNNLIEEKGREPNIEELADAMQVSVKEIGRLQSELRADLMMSMDNNTDDELGGFYEFVDPSLQDPKVKEIIEFIYFDSDPTDKKILDYTLGLHGNSIYPYSEISTMLRLTPTELKKRREELAAKIKELS